MSDIPKFYTKEDVPKFYTKSEEPELPKKEVPWLRGFEYNVPPFGQTSKFAKEALSSATLGLSEKIPALDPGEEDILTPYAKTLGSLLPVGATKAIIANPITKAAFKPLINMAKKSPIFLRGLEGLRDITAWGLTGAAYEAEKGIVKGEIPTPKELATHASEWALIDSGLKTLGLTVKFGKAIYNISKADNIPIKDVVNNLWKATKNYAKQKFNRDISKPENVKPEDFQKLVEDAITIEGQIVSQEEVAINGIETSQEQAIQAPMMQQAIGYAPKESTTEIQSESQPIEMGYERREDLSAKQTPRTPHRKPIMGKEQAVAKSKIINVFRKAFKDPIRLGKISAKNTLGIHKVWPKISRILRSNDVETAAHEIGHNLHGIMFGKDAKTNAAFQQNVSAALAPYMSELKPISGYAPHDLEGFAEFTRMYVTDPNNARKLAPRFYSKFERDLDRNHPEIKNALLEARDYYDKYIHGTPESRVKSTIAFERDTPKQSVKEWIQGHTDNFKTQFLDDLYPMKKVISDLFGISTVEVETLKDEKNVYRALRVMKGSVGKVDVFLMHETFDPITLKRTGEGLRDILKDIPEGTGYEDFNAYVKAKRVLELTKRKVETGVDYVDALQTVKTYAKDYEKLSLRFEKWLDANLQYAQKSGLISKEIYDKIKRTNIMYTPMNRVMESERKDTSKVSSKLQSHNPIFKIKGSTRDTVPAIESAIKNAYSIILNSEKNLTAQKLAKLATMKGAGIYVEKVPTPIGLKDKILGEQVRETLAKNLFKIGANEFLDFVQKGGTIVPVLKPEIDAAIPEAFLRFGAKEYPKGENIITVYQDGKPEYYEVSQDLFDMWNRSMDSYTANTLVKILRIPARALRYGAIMNPKFAVKNAWKDSWGKVIFSRYHKSIKDPVGLFMDTLYSPLAMLAQAAKKGPLYVEWLKSGGGMSTMQSLYHDDVVKKISEIKYGYSPKQLKKWIEQVAQISEEANRLSEFAQALEVEADTRLGREIAAFAARDLSVDFAKMGLQVKAINQIIPFFNATIQGSDKLLRSLGNPETRNKALFGIVASIVFPSLILAWLNKDDERVDEFTDIERDSNFITFIGSSVLKIPVPFETGVIAHGLTQRMFKFFMSKDPAAFEEFMGSVKSAMLPNFLPTALLPFFETWANKSFFTGGRIVPAGSEKLISRYQFKNSTSITARLLGRAINYMAGMDTTSVAASPAIIDHFITSWSGGLGRLMVNILDMAFEKAGMGGQYEKPTRSITQRLGLDIFTTEYPRASMQSVNKFYDYYDDATTKFESLKKGGKLGLDEPEVLEQMEVRYNKIYDYNSMKAFKKALDESQRTINNITIAPELTGDEKKIMISELYLQQIEACREANKEIKKYKLAS